MRHIVASVEHTQCCQHSFCWTSDLKLLSTSQTTGAGKRINKLGKSTVEKISTAAKATVKAWQARGLWQSCLPSKRHCGVNAAKVWPPVGAALRVGSSQMLHRSSFGDLNEACFFSEMDGLCALFIFLLSCRLPSWPLHLPRRRKRCSNRLLVRGGFALNVSAIHFPALLRRTRIFPLNCENARQAVKKEEEKKPDASKAEAPAAAAAAAAGGDEGATAVKEEPMVRPCGFAAPPSAMTRVDAPTASA